MKRTFEENEEAYCCCIACGGCCAVFIVLLLSLGFFAMTGLGIFYIATNAGPALINPLDGWNQLPMPRTGYSTQNTVNTGNCAFTSVYGEYNITCAYPGSNCAQTPGVNNMILYNNCTCDVPSGSLAYSYYKSATYPPEFHCGEIKSNAENIHFRNVGIILIVVPYGFSFILAFIYACISVCCLSAPKKKPISRNTIHVLTDV